MKNQPAPPERVRIPFQSCPLCPCTRLREVRRADCTQHPLYRPIIPRKMVWMACADCGHVFTDGYFTPETMASIFSRTQEAQQPGYRFEEMRLISAGIVERITRFVTGGHWLDVGYGNGSLLFTAQEYGFVPVGLDLRPASVAGMKKFGIEAHCLDIFNLVSVAKFNVVSMADVLEHMPFPDKALQAAHRLMADDAVLFVSLPSFDCAAWRLLDMANSNPYWAEIEHFHNFSRDRLYSLLQATGFEPVAYGVSERYRIGMEIVARRRH